jgi:hypothetical protein
MKKTLAVFAFLFMVAATSQAQDDYQKFRMGFKMSPNISWMQPQDKHFVSESSALRFGFGFVADVFFAENYAIGTGVNIMRNGGEFSFLKERLEVEDGVETAFISRYTRNYNNQYVEIPLTFKLRTNEIGYITYWGQFGVGAGVNINSRGDEEIQDIEQRVFTTQGLPEWQSIESKPTIEENVNFADDIRLFRVGLILSAGIEYSLSGSSSVLIGVTYNNGFTNVFTKQDVVRTDEGNPVYRDLDTGGQAVREDVRLRAVSNSFELNLGILF